MVRQWLATKNGARFVIGVLIVVCSIVMTLYFLQRNPVHVDMQKDRYFRAFSTREHAPYADFRWVLPGATVLFPPQWVDMAVLPHAAAAQIITLTTQDITQVRELQVANIWFRIDEKPRIYRILTARHPDVSLATRTYFQSADDRSLGVPLFAVSRTLTRWGLLQGLLVWGQVVLVLVVLSVATAYMQRLLSVTIPWWALLMHIGMWLVWWLASPGGNGEWVLGWGFVCLTLVMLRRLVRPWRWAWVAYMGLLAIFIGVRIWVIWWQASLTHAPVLDSNLVYEPLPLAGEPYWSWAVWLMVMLGIRVVAGSNFNQDSWFHLCVCGCVLVSARSLGYYPAHGWMNMISLDYLRDWQGVWEFIRTSRVAIPPVLLVVEFAIHRITTLGVWYYWLFPRAVVIFAMVLAVFRVPLGQRERMLRTGMVVAWMYAFSEVRNLDNYFVYDVLFGAVLLCAVHLAFRVTFVAWQWAVIGMLLVFMDTLRPYGIAVLLGVVPWLIWQSWRTHRRAGVAYLCIPLLLSVCWHLHFVVNLGQSNWSNHTGYNLCRAWECPVPAGLEPEAPPLAADLWNNLNTPIHERNSQRWLQSGMAYQLAHPDRAIIHTGELLLDIVVLPYQSGTPAWFGNGWVVDSYRLMMIGWMVLQLGLCLAIGKTLLVAVYRRTPITEQYWIVHGSIILLILVLPNLVEAGENYRFIAGTAMWLVALPPWAQYRAYVGQLWPRQHR